MARQATKLTSFDPIDSNQKWLLRIESAEARRAAHARFSQLLVQFFFLELIHVHMAKKTGFSAELLMADLV
jgi:hypothetical protein